MFRNSSDMQPYFSYHKVKSYNTYATVASIAGLSELMCGSQRVS